MKISYAITACNEHEELDRLLSLLDSNIDSTDEVVIQLDTTATDLVKEVCHKYPSFSLIEFPLNKDFASFKNNLKSKCTGDWIFQIDADELLDPVLIQNMHEILSANQNVEVFSIPRINTVDGLTKEHIRRWGWNVDNRGWVNFPDYQMRVLKNIERVKWINKVHEKIVGHTLHAHLPMDQEYCILHHKTISRQEAQNNLYNNIQ
jgi:glycosyltransferase involved in cell wall biosynthesis